MATPEAERGDERNIVVTGFMGAGKTTVGRKLALLLERRFVDSDDVITERAGANIPQIFARDGEVGFRALEKEVCRDLAVQTGLVIATGGGMLVDDENRAAMLENGLVVCLDAGADVLRERLAAAAHRPLAGDWEALFEKRRAAYTSIPHHVDVTGKTPRVIAEEIISLWHASR
ncbi:MAG: shikimate kinase [Chloroflexota bacterium]